MTTDDGALPLVVGQALEPGDVGVDGFANQLRSVAAGSSAASDQAVDLLECRFVHSDRNGFHIANNIMPIGSDGPRHRAARDWEEPRDADRRDRHARRRQAVLVRAVLLEALGGIDHEDAFAGGGVRLVEDEDARRDARAVRQIGGQADDGLEVAGAREE